MNKQMVHTFAIFLTLLLLFQKGGAETPPATLHNPKPAAGDLILPMPQGGGMVFRKVGVPGRGFWGETERVVQLGDGEGGVFEGLQRVQVNGSFPAASGEAWVSYLGKYEVTKAQFAAVMGFDQLLEVLGDSAEREELKRLQAGKINKALAKPLVFVTWDSVRRFIRAYNLWLFDEKHPERLEAMPRFQQEPGFVRLPTEIEWEYAARGGHAALKNDTFHNKLPFPEEKLVQYAWYLKNAKHRVRPAGLRLPNPLGLYDMFGNAQELTIDPFRPEIWQGKPGGLCARGGSVGTQAVDVRSAHREEVEIFKWDSQANRMREWRSYNTGIRLAIGSNVVVSPENRKSLENEYRDYRKTIRTEMPVGRTLDNPVAQAATQLNDAQATLETIMEQNSHLRRPLSSIQRFIEQAEEKLDHAQRETARSTAQDALREATDLGRDMFKLESLRQQQSKAERLGQLSTRYQDLVTTLKTEIARRQEYARQLLERYGEDLGNLGEYSPAYISQALKALGEKKLTNRAAKALELLTRHVDHYQATRRAHWDAWWGDFNEEFKNLAD